jgi:hypothetical protein
MMVEQTIPLLCNHKGKNNLLATTAEPHQVHTACKRAAVKLRLLHRSPRYKRYLGNLLPMQRHQLRHRQLSTCGLNRYNRDRRLGTESNVERFAPLNTAGGIGYGVPKSMPCTMLRIRCTPNDRLTDGSLHRNISVRCTHSATGENTPLNPLRIQHD